MKKVYILFILVGSLYADATLSQKIQSLKSVPKNQRYKIINSIKRDLAKLNSAQRVKAIKELRASMKLKGKQHGEGRKHHYRKGKLNNRHDMKIRMRKRDGSNFEHNEKKLNKPQHQKIKADN